MRQRHHRSGTSSREATRLLSLIVALQLAERLGIAQQTLAHYEVARARIAASFLPRVAELLDLSLDELLIGAPIVRLPGKRGPVSRIERQLDAVSQLPKARQRVVSEVLDAMLAQHAA